MKLKIKIIVLSIIILSFSCSCNCFAGNDFTHTLELAKYSACKDIAKDFSDGKSKIVNLKSTPAFPKFSGRGAGRLREIKNSPFPWRFEITNGYQEGFVYYALLGYANELSGDIPFAYRCYQNSLACIDEDKSFDFPLPRAEVYLAIGRTCLAAGRYMDAEEYMSFVCSITSTNKPIHWQAVAVLADISRRYGRFDRALAFYTTLFNIKPMQPSDIWYVYIQTLFDMGYYEFGVETILNGLRQNGVTSNMIENDCFLKAARRYWLHFSNDDIIKFYKLLGLELKRQKVKGNEKLIALLINTRRLIQKVYLLLITHSQDDLAQLKARLEHSKSEINNQIVTITKHSQKVLGAFSKKKHNTQIQTIYTNNCIEDAINSILIKQTRLNGEYQSVSVTLWTNLLSKFTIKDFRQVEIDYSSALFIIYAGIGKAYYCKAFPQYSESYIRRQMEFIGYTAEDEYVENYFDEEMVKQTDKWLAKAVNEIDDEINPDRFADVLRLRGLIYLIPDFGNTNKALEYLNHAFDLASDNVPLMLNILGTLSSINNLEVKDNFYQDEINRVYEKYGNCIPRDIFYDLAKKQFEKGDNYAGLNIVLDGLKRTPLRILNDKLLRLVFQNQSFCKYNQLKLLQRALLTSLMRIPATPTKNNEFLQIINSSRRPWLSNQIILANIEESQKYSKKNFDIITGIMKTNFSIRAGLLFTKAQEIRQENNKEIELTGCWLNCSEYIISALRKKQGLVANKNYLKTGKQLIELFENSKKQISTNQLSRVLKDKKELEKLLNREKL